MEIRPTLTALLDTSRPDTAPLLQRLQPGQTLQATVLALPRSGVAELQIGLTALLAHTRLPLQPGMQLQLEVTRLQPLPELRLLADPQPVSGRDQVLLTALPRQLPLPQVFTRIAEVLRTAGDTLPPPLRALLAETVTRATGNPRHMDPTRVAEQVRSSGIFLEGRLARGELPAADLKLNLLRLLDTIRTATERAPTAEPNRPAGEMPLPAPADSSQGQAARWSLELLQRQVESALARIHTQQAASLPAEPGTRQVWQFDLPLFAAPHYESVMVRIEREAETESRRATADPGWSITLRFDFASTGRIHARIAVQGEQVSSTFWCENPETEGRLDHALPRLEAAFRSAGLEVGRLASLSGAPPDPVDLPKPAQGMLDARA